MKNEQVKDTFSLRAEYVQKRWYSLERMLSWMRILHIII